MQDLARPLINYWPLVVAVAALDTVVIVAMFRRGLGRYTWPFFVMLPGVTMLVVSIPVRGDIWGALIGLAGCAVLTWTSISTQREREARREHHDLPSLESTVEPQVALGVKHRAVGEPILEMAFEGDMGRVRQLLYLALIGVPLLAAFVVAFGRMLIPLEYHSLLLLAVAVTALFVWAVAIRGLLVFGSRVIRIEPENSGLRWTEFVVGIPLTIRWVERPAQASINRIHCVHGVRLMITGGRRQWALTGRYCLSESDARDLVTAIAGPG